MKILHIIDSGGLYGAEIMLLNLIDEQIKQGLKPVIASIGERNEDEKPIETEAIKKRIKVKKFRMTQGPNVFGAWKILKFAYNQNVDILHSHGYKGNILLGLLLKPVRRSPLITTLHGWTSTTAFNKKKVYEWLDSISLCFIDRVVLVSETMLANFQLNVQKRINYKVVHNGIPETLPQKTHRLDKEITEFCKDGFIIGSLGRLSAEKGYRYLIDALALLRKKAIDAKLIIIGEGDQRSLLESMIREKGLQDRVYMPGYRVNAKYYFPLFNVYAIPSITEGLPISLLEAMQAKVPVVATNVGGIPDVLHYGDSGLLVGSCDSKALSEKLAKIYKKTSLGHSIADMAYKRVSTIYSSKTMALGYYKIYKELIKNEKARKI